MSDSSIMDRIEIVLVEPKESGNIGSTCRAMKTMGLSRLTIVGDAVYDERIIRTFAVHSHEIWQQHRRVESLEKALQDSVLAAGTSRRRGKKRKYFFVSPEQLASRVQSIGEGTVSVVFGREATGLTDEELSLCHLCVEINSAPEQGSLNLSQAVQVISYVLFNAERKETLFRPIDEKRIREVTDIIDESLERIDYYKGTERPLVRSYFHDIIGRASLDEKEAQRMEKVFRKIAKLKVHKGR